jgi:8-oxo-dGTP pyrophosphatase MutT (NUDIX family)
MKEIIKRWRESSAALVGAPIVSKGILVSQNKILILKRNPSHITTSSPWSWDLPGGHLEGDEGPVGALEREVMEELGLTVERPTEAHRDSKTVFYKIVSWGGVIRLSNEHTEFRWIKFKDLEYYNIGAMYKLAIKASQKV